MNWACLNGGIIMTTLMNLKNKDITISYDTTSVQIVVPMDSGKNTWEYLSSILSKLFGDTAIIIMSRMLNAMSTIIASDNKCSVSTRINIDNKRYIDIATSKNQLLIKADGFQVKPHTA